MAGPSAGRVAKPQSKANARGAEKGRAKGKVRKMPAPPLKQCVACRSDCNPHNLQTGPDGLRSLCIHCFKAYAESHILPLFLWPSGQVSVARIPDSRQIIKYRIRAPGTEESDDNRFLRPEILQLESRASALQSSRHAFSAHLAGAGPNFAPVAAEAPRHSEQLGTRNAPTPTRSVARQNGAPFDRGVVSENRAKSDWRAMNGGLCAACKQLCRAKDLRQGPDGTSTLCVPCFRAYSVYNTLPIFLWPSNKVSAAPIPGALRVSKYRMPAAPMGQLPGTRFLRPEITELEPVSHSLAEQHRRPNTDPAPAPEPHGATHQQGELGGTAVPTPDRAAVSRNPPPVHGSSPRQNGPSFGAKQGSSESTSICRDKRRSKTPSDGNASGTAPSKSQPDGTRHDHRAPGASPTASPTDQGGAAPVEGQAVMPNPQSRGTAMPPEHVFLGDKANGCRGIPQWPMPSFDARGCMQVDAGASVWNEQPTATFYAVKATLSTSAGRGAVRRFTVPADASFEVFERTIGGLFGLQARFLVSYRDDDGDEVSVTSSNELAEMFVIADRANISPVRLTVAVG